MYKELKMNFFSMLVNDPVVMYSVAGLAILLGICAYYVYYFVTHVIDDK